MLTNGMFGEGDKNQLVTGKKELVVRTIYRIATSLTSLYLYL